MSTKKNNPDVLHANFSLPIPWCFDRRYEGEWENDLQHGQGTFYFADSSCFKGSWVQVTPTPLCIFKRAEYHKTNSTAAGSRYSVVWQPLQGSASNEGISALGGAQEVWHWCHLPHVCRPVTRSCWLTKIFVVKFCEHNPQAAQQYALRDEISVRCFFITLSSLNRTLDDFRAKRRTVSSPTRLAGVTSESCKAEGDTDEVRSCTPMVLDTTDSGKTTSSTVRTKNDSCLLKGNVACWCFVFLPTVSPPVCGHAGHLLYIEITFDRSTRGV